jgi:hypothetical protein
MRHNGALWQRRSAPVQREAAAEQKKISGLRHPACNRAAKSRSLAAFFSTFAAARRAAGAFFSRVNRRRAACTRENAAPVPLFAPKLHLFGADMHRVGCAPAAFCRNDDALRDFAPSVGQRRRARPASLRRRRDVPTVGWLALRRAR